MNFRTFLTTSGLIACLALTANAQTYTETGDAGDIPETAQATGAVSCQSPISQINGNLDANDTDMYAICITDPANFTATTTGGATFDTQLWLFNGNGLGVTANDDNPAGGLQSRITGTFVPAPGTYYLAVSGYNHDPLNCGDALIWNNTPFGTERPPDGPGAAVRVRTWSGAGGGGAYSIFLTGTSQATRTSPQSCNPFVGWDEQENGGGDAGNLPETAQATGTTACGSALPRIRGQVSAGDADMYAIYIENPTAFNATTVGSSSGDTQLWLFDTNGNGVTFNDDSSGTFQSTISGLNVPSAGIYYLAVSTFDHDAVDCNGAELWADTPFAVERAPDGSGSGRVGNWAGGSGSANYVVELQGACTAPRAAAPDRCQFDGWDEQENGGGDAGDLPATAQKVHSSGSDPCQTPVARVRGTLDENDVDMYVICITDPGAFNASTVGSTGFDTQLWLFNCDGTGVTFNDDSTGLQSTITGQFLTAGATYLLAISSYDRDAVDAGGSEIWEDTPFGVERQPDGPGAANPVAGWIEDGFGSGPYTINLQGAYFVSEAGCEGGPQCEGDDNNDGCVDDADLLNVLFNFGSFGIGIPGDVNDDFIVDDVDLLIVLFNFGCGCGE
jgi:hypothetical protein